MTRLMKLAIAVIRIVHREWAAVIEFGCRAARAAQVAPKCRMRRSNALRSEWQHSGVHMADVVVVGSDACRGRRHFKAALNRRRVIGWRGDGRDAKAGVEDVKVDCA